MPNVLWDLIQPPTLPSTGLFSETVQLVKIPFFFVFKYIPYCDDEVMQGFITSSGPIKYLFSLFSKLIYILEKHTRWKTVKRLEE